MQVDDKWWWFFDGEQFDTDETRWLELADGIATDRDGARGTFLVEGHELRIAMPDGDVLTVRQAGPRLARPIWLSGSFSVDDDLVVFAKDGDWADKMTARNRERAARAASEHGLTTDDRPYGDVPEHVPAFP